MGLVCSSSRSRASKVEDGATGCRPRQSPQGALSFMESNLPSTSSASTNPKPRTCPSRTAMRPRSSGVLPASQTNQKPSCQDSRALLKWISCASAVTGRFHPCSSPSHSGLSWWSALVRSQCARWLLNGMFECIPGTCLCGWPNDCGLADRHSAPPFGTTWVAFERGSRAAIAWCASSITAAIHSLPTIQQAVH